MSVSSQPNSADSSNAAKPTRPDLAHSTGVADSGRWSTRRIAMYALFVALAMATSFISFPILPNPAFSFLKYDPSGIVCLIAGFAYGPAAAAIVSVLGFVPHVFMDPWGTLMAVLVALSLSVPAALIYRHVHTRKGAVIGLVVGALLALVAGHRRQSGHHADLHRLAGLRGGGHHRSRAAAVQPDQVRDSRRGHVPGVQADFEPAESLT